MTTGVTCIITGCAIMNDNRWLSGDLFVTMDGTYIFNATVPKTVTCETPWDDWNDGEPFYTKQIMPADWFERRGVFVIPKFSMIMNDAAREYIKC